MIRLKRILLEGMTLDVADTIFLKFGVPNASSLDQTKLRNYYIALVKKHHPDAGGNNDTMQYINAAYDVLKDSPIKKQTKNYGYGDAYQPHQKEYDDYDKSYNTYQHQSNQRKSASQNNRPTGWAQAGWSGGMPNSEHIYQENFNDLNYCKKTAWEISGKPPFDKDHEYTFQNWDGNYFRGSFSVYATPEKLFEISKMLIKWDRFFKSVAVFYNHRSDKSKIYLVNLRGKEINPPQEFEHDSFNSNPGNDNSFTDYLRKNLE